MSLRSRGDARSLACALGAIARRWMHSRTAIGRADEQSSARMPATLLGSVVESRTPPVVVDRLHVPSRALEANASRSLARSPASTSASRLPAPGARCSTSTRSTTGPSRARFDLSTTSVAPPVSASTAASSPIVPERTMNGRSSMPHAHQRSSASRRARTPAGCGRRGSMSQRRRRAPRRSAGSDLDPLDRQVEAVPPSARARRAPRPRLGVLEQQNSQRLTARGYSAIARCRGGWLSSSQ